MKPITIIMPYLNEGQNPYNTLVSLYRTADNNLFDIIIIDDCSKIKTDFKEFVGHNNIKFIENKNRIGVDACRQLGADMSETPYLLIIDAHMDWYDGSNWLNKVIDCVEREPENAWCFTCLGMGDGITSIYNHNGKYYGADFLFYNKNVNPERVSRECLEPKWKPKKNEVEYEIPCILGANYAFSKKQFDKIHGLNGLKSWGSSEPLLSLKNYMCGATSKINTSIEFGHIFRNYAPYETQIKDLYYNKILLCKLLFDDVLSDNILSCLPKNINLKNAFSMIDKDMDFIKKERLYLDSIRKRDIYDYCKHFDIII